jgi:hypothetical protein
MLKLVNVNGNGNASRALMQVGQFLQSWQSSHFRNYTPTSLSEFTQTNAELGRVII